MPYKDDEIIDLRSSIHVRAEDRFAETFMKFAQPAEKTASESATQPASARSETETAGTLESNVDKDTADINHIGKTRKETNGADSDDPLGMDGNAWGEQPPMGNPATNDRRADTETLSSSAEEGNLDDNYELLRKNFSNMDEASKVDKELIRQRFTNGKPGEYNTRAQTLLDKVRGTTGRS